MCWKPDTMANPRSLCVCKTSPLKEPVGVNLFVRETEKRVQDNRSRGHRPVLVNRVGIGPHALGANRNICFYLDLAVVEHSQLRPTLEGCGGDWVLTFDLPLSHLYTPSLRNSSSDIHSQFIPSWQGQRRASLPLVSPACQSWAVTQWPVQTAVGSCPHRTKKSDAQHVSLYTNKHIGCR